MQPLPTCMFSNAATRDCRIVPDLRSSRLSDLVIGLGQHPVLPRKAVMHRSKLVDHPFCFAGSASRQKNHHTGLSSPSASIFLVLYVNLRDLHTIFIRSEIRRFDTGLLVVDGLLSLCTSIEMPVPVGITSRSIAMPVKSCEVLSKDTACCGFPHAIDVT